MSSYSDCKEDVKTEALAAQVAILEGKHSDLQQQVREMRQEIDRLDADCISQKKLFREKEATAKEKQTQVKKLAHDLREAYTEILNQKEKLKSQAKIGHEQTRSVSNVIRETVRRAKHTTVTDVVCQAVQTDEDWEVPDDKKMSQQELEKLIQMQVEIIEMENSLRPEPDWLEAEKNVLEVAVAQELEKRCQEADVKPQVKIEVKEDPDAVRVKEELIELSDSE